MFQNKVTQIDKILGVLCPRSHCQCFYYVLWNDKCMISSGTIIVLSLVKVGVSFMQFLGHSIKLLHYLFIYFITLFFGCETRRLIASFLLIKLFHISQRLFRNDLSQVFY